MKRALLACVLGAVVAVAPTRLVAQGMADGTADAVDEIFAAWSSSDSPGCAVGAYHEGKLVFSRGYGMANLEHGVPIRPSSIFHVASISKQFTATAIALLATDGRLSLDDDVRKYVPEVPDFGSRITIRHLIHHTSGLRDQWDLLALAGWRADDPKSQDDILRLISRQRALNFEPGAEYLYSNTGYTLLAVVVERVSGRTLREFADERIFAPLGMTSTHFHDDHAMIVPGRTDAYVERDGEWKISIPVFDNHGATSLFTTVEDLAKWDANFDRPVVGDASLIELLHTRGKLKKGETIPYAFALMHGEHRGLRTVGHSGSDAGYRADYLRFPDQAWSFATLCNVPVNAGGLNRRVAEAFLADAMTPVVPPVAVSSSNPTPTRLREMAPATDPAEFVGHYRSDELDVTWRISVDPDGARLHLPRLDERSLAATAKDELRAGGWRLDFQRDPDGNVTGFHVSTGRVRNLRFDRIDGTPATPGK